ncbi:MAG: TRAM domain-containing protein, partial [Patescibacteria group bacterium]
LQQNKKMVWQTVRVLVEGKSKTTYLGKTATSKKVKISSNHPLTAGSFVNVTMTEAQDFGLVGRSQ